MKLTYKPTPAGLSALHLGFRALLSVLALFVVSQSALATSFAGSYSGTFTGADTGTWSATITTSGVVSGTGYSAALGVSFAVTGQVTTSGALTMGSVTAGSTFTGNINSTTGATSGTWTDGYSGGNFTGTGNITPGTAPSSAPISNARVFAFAEANAPGIFPGTASAGQYQQYDYRYYPASGNYLAVDTSGEIFILGPYTGGAIQSIGPVASFADSITAWEATQVAAGGGTTTIGEPSGDVSGDTSTTGRLQAGSSLTGTIGFNGDKDWYAISLTAGVPYTFDLQGVATLNGTLPNPALYLNDSNGNLITHSDDVSLSNNDSRIAFTPSGSGIYYLMVFTRTPPDAGTYLLSATSTGILGFIPPPSTTWLQVGTSGLFRFSSTQPISMPVNLTAGKTYNFALSDNSNGTFSPVVHKPLGRLLDSQNVQKTSPSISPVFTPSVDGTYYLETPAQKTGVLLSVTSSEAPGAAGGGSGLMGTWCTDIGGNQNCWVFDNNTGSSMGSFYQQSINQYSGTLTNTMTWSVDINAQTLTYQFTWSTLSNSAYDYSQAVTQRAYTFPFTVNALEFIFQDIIFYKKL